MHCTEDGAGVHPSETLIRRCFVPFVLWLDIAHDPEDRANVQSYSLIRLMS